MLHEILISLLISLGIMNPIIDVQTAFTLFNEGHYQEACQVIKESKYLEVKQAKDDKERCLLQAAIHNADALDASPQERYIAVERALDTVLEKVNYDTFYVNTRDTYWQTALTTAVQKGNQDMVLYVYMHGADPRIKDVYGKTARDYAGDKELRQLLLGFEWETYDILRDKNNIWGLLKAGAFTAATNHVAHTEAHELLAMRDKLGNSLVLAALLYSHALSYKLSDQEKEQKIMSFLATFSKAVVDTEALSDLLDVQNKLGQTPLMWAAKYCYTQSIEWLHTHGADVTLCDVVGRDAYCYTTNNTVLDLLEDVEMAQEQGWKDV